MTEEEDIRRSDLMKEWTSVAGCGEVDGRAGSRSGSLDRV